MLDLRHILGGVIGIITGEIIGCAISLTISGVTITGLFIGAGVGIVFGGMAGVYIGDMFNRKKNPKNKG
ncbi:MAG: hypothetical protein AAB465_03250 [Patescibacteria group bacterium]